MSMPAELQEFLAKAKATARARPLPRLREDLVVSPGPKSASGLATWLIYDPLRHRFIDIDQATFEVLSLWPFHATVESLAAAAGQSLGRPSHVTEIERLAAFFESCSLTTGGRSDDWRYLSKHASSPPHGLVMTLVHNYLFFKIPLVSPQAFLQATEPFARRFFSPWVQGLIALFGIIGLYLVSRQWDEFLQETRGLATLGGIASFGAVLFVIKAFHELGHGYCAVRQGCRVPSMGLAFMMMAPLLYTDVTDAWRLADRRKRLAIDAAGIAVELMFACLATFVWVFLPDGLARHVAFLVATTSWVMSLAINLNPFMRFDGYYIFSDLLGVPNLQPRAFAMGTWQLREILFRLRAPSPEDLPPRISAVLIVYAWCVWIYRFFLFIGIAALVYTCVFKLLGVALFAFEIGYFIVKPIVKELLSWWTMRTSILRSRRSYATFGAVLVALALALVPWSTRVALPAVLEAGDVARVFPPRPARIKAVLVAADQRIDKGQVLAELVQPDIDHEQATITAKRDAVRLRLDRQSADRDDRDDKLVLESELAALTIRSSGLALEREELLVKAPRAGVVSELNPALGAGRWVGVKEQLVLITGEGGVKVRGYLPEDGLWRVEPGSTGLFVPEVALVPSASVKVTAIAAGSASVIDIPELASIHGGRIEVQADSRQRLVPSSAQYALTMDVTGAGARDFPGMSIRGTVILEGRAESLLASVYRRALKVLVRESGA